MSTDANTPEAQPVPVWPVWLLAAPAAVAIWSGWVGLGSMTGFGVVHPLPGIWDSATINTAITLPIGMEAYAAYALRAWLTPGTPDRARRYARASAIGALVLGALGQIAYHLMAAAGWTVAPWPVTALVACLPVGVLGMGAGLAHLLRLEDEPTPAPTPDKPGYREPAAPVQVTEPPRPAEHQTPAVPESQTPAVTESSTTAVRESEPAPRTAPPSRRPAERSPTPDARVLQLAERLDAGIELTGQTAGELLGCSARTGRRLLHEATELRTAATAQRAARNGHPVGTTGGAR
jgi:hypothetical protein